jgi:2-amino-4-hydroxy-6-hydroxymethyldihydropteridine diphosphokinase
LQIKNAIHALNELSEVAVLKDSGYFSSKPMGPEDQPDYINAVVEIETSLTAQELLKSCQLIEQQQGRIKTRRWGERTIDLDILLYADKKINMPNLTVPHPGICQRDFVYIPLLKLNSTIEIPGQGMLNRIVSSTVDNDHTVQHTVDNTVDNKGNMTTDYACQFSGNINRED